ncbi:unnamed protein product [Calypogeia fissa]
MGNTPVSCVSGGGVEGQGRKIRVLLPDGNIVLLTGPVEAADLMLEHINHMVMHCASVPGSTTAKGERKTAMTILQPHETLQPGQAYILHPIPSPSTTPSKRKPKLRRQAQFSVPNLRSSEKDYENGENSKNQESQPTPFKQIKTEFLQRYQRRVTDSSMSENATQTPESRPSSTSGRPLRRLLSEESRDHAKEDDHGGVLLNLNLNMYMGWRPALESIPESPRGWEMMQQPPLLCV